jgi:lipopolysaccharide/colanic/teichoic acid biosynthesis glycosyltransferase
MPQAMLPTMLQPTVQPGWQNWLKPALKRALDLVAAVAGLVALAVPLALIAVAVSVEDRRSPFFRGRRVARLQPGGPLSFFHMVKFRTMVVDAWRSGVNSTAAGDRRVTRIGRLLRKTKLDELPQLWNVLVGDMSLVGPRPQVETDASLYTPEERRMLEVRPGITDLASIVFADEGEILAGAKDPDLLYNQIVRPWKSRLALMYVEHASPRTDLRILALTLVSAVSRGRALAGAAKILRRWGADPLLLQMASRTAPLAAWPPPGATAVVQEYPRPSGGSNLPLVPVQSQN